ncbi:glycosyltransferase involved in cell wall biosynthesis [Azospirillum canadense]|nr:glycosyltransferase involved in cell wall biosynthesis [Azospirillum canadense]
MASAGWRVTVVADGDGPSAAPPGVTVVRTGAGPMDSGAGEHGSRRGAATMVRDYLDALRRLTSRAMRLPRHDVVVTMTDPPLMARVGPMLAAWHGAAAVHWCHDLYPALLPVLGLRIPDPLYRLVEWSVAGALRRHDAVVAIGRCMARQLGALGVPAERIVLLPNWAEPGIRPVAREDNRFRAELGLGERFTIAYSGNLGLAHPMGGVLDAAAELARTDPDLAFLVIGEGRGRPALETAAASRGLRNLRVLPLQPVGRLSESLSAADLHLASMDPRAEGLLVPCKVAGALAAGRPCLFLGPAGSEAAALVDGCGRVLDPADGAGLAAAVRGYARDPVRCAEEGRRALSASVRWGADAAARRFTALAESLLERAARPVTTPAVATPLVRVTGRRLPHA